MRTNEEKRMELTKAYNKVIGKNYRATKPIEVVNLLDSLLCEAGSVEAAFSILSKVEDKGTYTECLKAALATVEAPKATVEAPKATVEAPKATVEAPKAAADNGDLVATLAALTEAVKSMTATVHPTATVQPTAAAVLKHPLQDKCKAVIQAGLEGGFWLYMYGKAGTGKSSIARTVAAEMGLTYSYQSSTTTAYELIGYNNANGEYVPTAFYQAYKDGGLFLLDEMDACSRDSLVALNNAIEESFYVFPCGRIDRHKEFVLVGAGNTMGTGAVNGYSSRDCLDLATLNRFRPLEITYSEQIDRLCCGGNDSLQHLFGGIRAWIDYSGIIMVATPRDEKKVASLLDAFGITECIHDTLFLTRDSDFKQCLSWLSMHDEYKDNEYVQQMRKEAL